MSLWNKFRSDKIFSHNFKQITINKNIATFYSFFTFTFILSANIYYEHSSWLNANMIKIFIFIEQPTHLQVSEKNIYSQSAFCQQVKPNIINFILKITG